MPTQTSPDIRLDLWLWAARWFKTRSIAKAAIESGRVTLAGDTVKPSRPVRVGDKLEIVRANERYEIEVRGLAAQRGPAKVAETLYAEDAEARERRLAAREQRRLEVAGYKAPDGKPDKRARRLIRALGDLDAL